jgi:oligopeptide transport system substrate-binding protein
MTDRRALTRVAALAGAVLLTVAACGSDDSTSASGDGDTAPPAGDYTGGEVHTSLLNPTTLLSTDLAEGQGGTILDVVYTGLVDFDTDSGEPVYEVAESIETEDNIVWDITLKEGWTFHNGEPVDADAFLRSWNHGAYGPNAQRANSFYERIEGHDRMQEEGGSVTELSGLEKTGDLSFQVTLNAPFSTFELMLSHDSFLPMAQACLDDLEACAAEPIGNGPFKMAGPWEHDVQIALERWEDYPGRNPANIDSLVFHIYADERTAYNDFQAGTLDILRTAPPELRESAREQYGDRFIEEHASSVTVLTFPTYDDFFADPKARQALSLAVNRSEISESVLLDGVTPADSFISPLVPGHQSGVCEACEYDPDRARELLAEVGGWPAGEKLQIHIVAGGVSDAWAEAVGIQIKNTLGIDFELRNELELAEYLGARHQDKMEGPYSTTWSMNWPSQEYYLSPIYRVGGHTADHGWTSDEFEALMKRGDQAPSLEEAQDLYAEAERVLMEELPAMPLFYGRSSVIYQDSVEDVRYDVYHSNPAWTDVKVK